MKIYILSLIVGILVGVIYSLVNVRSPAPPTWALVGLLGMLIGEQAIPLVKEHFFNSSAHVSTDKPTDSENNSNLQ